jgi:hypothetical protein
VIELDAGRYKITRDGAPADEAFPRVGSHEDVLAAGYVPLLDVYPGVQKKPFSEIAADLADLYVQARPIPAAANVG